MRFARTWLFSALFIFLLLPQAHARPVILEHTESFLIRSSRNKVIYNIWVSLPKSYEQNTERTYPVVYLLDAPHTFPIARGIMNHLSERKLMPEMILLGVGYANDDSETVPYHESTLFSNRKMNRTRDYTPVVANESGAYGEMYNKFSGQSALFRAFLAEELIPNIEKRYRASKLRTIVGHSYGGLFATWVYATQPELFTQYLAVSPSLWYEDEWLGRCTRSNVCAKMKNVSGKKLYISVGGDETHRLVGSAHRFYQQLLELQKNQKPSVVASMPILYESIPHEIHNTTFSTSFTHGMRFFFEGNKNPSS